MITKSIASITIAIQQQLTQRGQLLGRAFLYLMVVYLFYHVFQSVGAPIERVWYVAVTEWVILSTPPLYLKIAQDLRSGQMVYFILRPMSYLLFRFYEGMGILIVRFILTGILCLCLGFYLTRHFPGDFIHWLLGVLFCLLSIILYSLISILIGLCSFWIKEIHPLYYLNFTAMASFGGLLIPLDYYSETLRTIGFCTPYPWILWWPAQWITNAKVDIGYALFAWGFWMLMILLLIKLVYNHCLNHFVEEGG